MKLTRSTKGFTLLELVMVILIIGLLASVAVAYFNDMRTEAKNAATQGALGGLHTAISVAHVAIVVNEDPSTVCELTGSAPPCQYPTINIFANELVVNKFLAAFSIMPFNPVHPVLAAANTNIFDPATFPIKNPWSPRPTRNAQWIFNDCDAGPDGYPATREGWMEDMGCNLAGDGSDCADGFGWCYAETSGDVWPDTANNGGGPGLTEWFY